MTRKHINVHLHYAPTPLRLSQRFPFLESLTLKGYPSNMDLPQKSGVITPWIREISVSFKSLKSLHIRNLAIHDSDLELLARTRGKDLKVLKIVECEGISENGLMHISKGCNELKTLCLDFKELDREEGCTKWLQELALRNVGIETFSAKYFCDQLDVKDVALLVKVCSKSLISLTVNTSYIDDLADVFSHAVKLEHFCGALYREDMEYSSFKFPSTIRSLAIYDFPETSLPFVYPLLNQLRELTFMYLDAEEDCQCFIQRCPNLEVLDTEDICGDKGLQVISQSCKKLRKLRFRYCSGTRMGLIAVAQGCRNLEFLHIQLTDISNEALECIGTNLKYLRAFYLIVCKNEDDQEIISQLDSGFRAMLIGCTKLERLIIDLYEEYLTDIGLGFIGKYGINLISLSLASIGGSDEGLRALSMGCPRLRNFRIQGCDFSEQAIANFLLNVHSLRYIWVLDKDCKIVSALMHPNIGSSTMQAQVRTELKPYVTLAKKIDRLVGQFVTGGCGLKSVNVTYASARAPDDLAIRLLGDIVAKGIHISEEQIFMDGPLLHEIIQVKIADVESGFVGAISETKDLTVEGTLKYGVPYLTKVGVFEVDVNLEGNIILCRQVDQPGIIGSVGTILGEEKVNVSFMSVGKTIRKEAVMAIVVDKKPRLNTLKKIGEIRGVKEVMFLAL